uniref:TIGR04255 family protein n=1 Tax=uncultured Elusimicrobia bacterium TaxID=699876 RepID=A0A650EMH1_9BACT|nr:hypothetical protein Elusimicrob1349_1020 [uncultured Elusimicrobia bacterium]
MIMNVFPKLKNPPIKEVVLGIGYTNHLANSEELDDLCDIFKESFPDKKPILDTSFNLTVETGCVESSTRKSGYSLTNKEKTETLLIDFNRITLVDRNQYISFEKFYEKFLNIFRQAVAFKKITSPRDIGLKFFNQFPLDQEELKQKKINFLPSINTKLESEEKDFAGWAKTSSRCLLQSLDCTEMQGLVSTDLQFLGYPIRLQTTLVIDTKINITTIDESLLCENVKKLQDFKNKIFFANVKPDVKDFNK